METRKIFFGSSDGQSTIHARIWTPSRAQAKGIVQIVHGASEHILRYHEFAEFMTTQGFVVCGNDHLGHGKSANGNFGFIGADGHKLLARDVHKLTSMVSTEFGLPVVLLGAGAGSLVARYVCAVWNIEYAGAAFLGTSCGSGGLNFLHRLIHKFGRYEGAYMAKEAPWINEKLQSRFNRTFRHSDHGPSWLTRDVYQVSNFEADPLCGFGLTYGAWMTLLKLNRIVNSHEWAYRITHNMPIYLLSGLSDPMGGFGRGVIKVYGDLLNAGCSNVEITLYQDARHELLFELNREEVFVDIAGWAKGLMV